MKKNRFFVFGLIALSFTLILAGCRENPKALAKQTYDLTHDALSNPLKIAGSLIKAANIKKKVDKLSDADKQIYTEELARLNEQGEGEAGGILGGLLNSDNTQLKEALSALMEALGNLKNLSGAVPSAPAEEPAASGDDSTTMESEKAAERKSSDLGDWTWTVADLNGALGKSSRDNYINKIVFGNDSFVVNSNNGSMAVSKDGVTWTAIDVGSIFNKRIDDSYIPIAFGKDKFVAGSNRGQIAYSSDGVEWTALDASGIFGSDRVAGIAFGTDEFIAVAEDNRKKAYSPDGINWTAVDSIYDSIAIIAYGNGKYIGVNNYETDAKMAYSYDGVKWTVLEDTGYPLDGRALTVITYCKDKFITGGYGGNILYSSDGIKWSAVNNSRIRMDVRDIIYADNKFVAGGNQGRISVSEDGIRWTAVSQNILGKSSNGLGYDVRTIAYGNGIFVAGGEDGIIAYSTGE